MFWKGCTTHCYIDYFGVKLIHPLNSMQFNTLIHSKESGKKQKTFKACQRLKYEIHENLWNVRLDVYSNLKTSLLNHPWRISFFFIYLSFIVKKSVKCSFWLLVVHSQLSLQHWNVCETNFTLTRIGEKYIQWGKTLFVPCWFCTFVHWQRNDQSIIFMVGLFEQWETE